MNEAPPSPPLHANTEIPNVHAIIVIPPGWLEGEAPAQHIPIYTIFRRVAVRRWWLTNTAYVNLVVGGWWVQF